MKKWSEILLVELMNSNVPVKVIGKSSVVFDTSFVVKTPNKDVLYSFQGIKSRSMMPEWEISFARIEIGGDGGTDMSAALKSLNFKVIHDLQGDMDMKSSLKVFSGVRKSLEMWLKHADMENEKKLGKEGRHLLTFYFTGKIEEFSRNKLYDKFAKVIAKKLNFKMKKGQAFGENRWDFWRVEK